MTSTSLSLSLGFSPQFFSGPVAAISASVGEDAPTEDTTPGWWDLMESTEDANDAENLWGINAHKKLGESSNLLALHDKDKTTSTGK